MKRPRRGFCACGHSKATHQGPVFERNPPCWHRYPSGYNCPCLMYVPSIRAPRARKGRP